MGENTIEWATVNRKLKIERIKRKIKKFFGGIKKMFGTIVNWVMENKEFVVMATPVVVGVTAKATKVWMAHREDVNRERRVYDPRLGRYSKMRRKLTNAEWREVDQRYAGGESYRSILDDMGVLK